MDASLGPTDLKDVFFIVARGPVPRDLSTFAENARSPVTTEVCCSDRCMARGTRSDARVASEGPRPTMKGGGFDNRSAGACPPRSLECADDGEGQVFPPHYDEIETGRARLPGCIEARRACRHFPSKACPLKNAVVVQNPR